MDDAFSYTFIIKKSTVRILIGPLVFLILWWVITSFHLIDTLLIANPQESFSRLWEVFFTGDILPDFIATMFRMLTGFFIAALIGIPVGLLLGSFPKVYQYFEVTIDFFRSLPGSAIFPLFLLVFGIGDLAKIAVVVYMCTWILIINTAYGVFHTPKGRIKYFQIIKAKKWQTFLYVTLPDALPHIIAGLRTALSLTLNIIIIIEMFVGTTFGLGQRIYNSQQTFQTSDLFASILLAGLIGYFLNKTFLIFEKKFIHWTGK